MAVVASVLVLSACGNKTNKSASDADSVATDSLAADTIEVKVDKHTEAYLRARVDSIYHGKQVSRDETYCTTGYKEVYKTASDLAEECEEIFLDYDHWTNSQDDTDFTCEVGKISNMSDTTATVKINAKNFGKRYNVVLSMRYERNDWFVDDFILTDGSGEKQAIEDYIKYRTFYQRFALNDLLYLIKYYFQSSKAEKSGLNFIYHDSVSEEEMDYDEYVYGRDIYKGEKRELGHEICKSAPHAFYFSMSIDTSTNGRLYFATKEDANSFYDRTSRSTPFNFEGRRIVVKKQPDGGSFLVQERFKDKSTSTMFAIHRPTRADGFYMVEVEIYV